MTRIGSYFFQYEVWIALFLVAVSAFEPKYLPVSLAGFFIICGFRFYNRKRLSIRTWADLPVLVLLVMSGVTLLISIDPHRTREQLMRLWVGIGLFYSVINWVNSTSRLRLLARLTILTGLLLAILTPFITGWDENFLLSYSSFYRYFPMLTQNLANPNVIAGSLGLYFVLCFGILTHGWLELDRGEKFFVITCLVFTGLLLFLTQSRGAILAAVLSCLFVASFTFKRGWVIFICIISLIIFLFERGIWYSFINFITGGTTISGIQGRIEIWSRAIYMLEDYPFTGIGMGLFGPVADTLYPFYEYSTQTVEHAHNLFLQVGVDLGIPGMVAWLAILGLTIMASFLMMKENKGSLVMGLGAGLLASQLFLILHGLTDSVVWGMVRPSPLVWLFWGLGFSAFMMSYTKVNEKIY